MPVALTDVDVDALKARLLHAFANRAQSSGLRSVAMADLARDLAISSKTLYRCFESKEAMVQALIDRWVEHLFEDLASHDARTRPDALTSLRRWGEAWVRGIQRFSPAFWAELERDYPHAHATYVQSVRELRHRARSSFAGDVRADMPIGFAQGMFLSMVRIAADPVFCERHGITRRDSVLAAIDLWATGSLDSGSISSNSNLKETRR